MDRCDDTLYVTAPPDEAPPGLKQRLVAKASALILPVVKRAARPYLGGDTIADALCVAERVHADGMASTIGYWDRGDENLIAVRQVYLDAIAAMAKGGDYLSVKPPALRFSGETAAELAAAAAPNGLRIHCDSHGPEVADLSNRMLEAMRKHLSPELIGTTLPGRWRRSLGDADWAVAAGTNVRVVKGQWPDPEDKGRDPSAGFLEVVDRLCGRARLVAVATHDFALGSEAIRRLQSAGTACEVEVLLGYPAKPLLNWAKANGVKVRVYVPYGGGFIPNAIGVLKRNPRLIFKVAAAQVDRLAALFR